MFYKVGGPLFGGKVSDILFKKISRQKNQCFRLFFALTGAISEIESGS
jgi:hypothetical protein